MDDIEIILDGLCNHDISKHDAKNMLEVLIDEKIRDYVMYGNIKN